jgi:hypothetical protein
LRIKILSLLKEALVNEKLWKLIIGGIVAVAGIAGSVLVEIFAHNADLSIVYIVAGIGVVGGVAIARS